MLAGARSVLPERLGSSITDADALLLPHVLKF